MAPSLSSYTVEFVGAVTGHGFTSWDPMPLGAVLSAVAAWERDGVFQILRVTRDSDGAVLVATAPGSEVSL